jgi:polysaccharide deacetylase 2 family uncharacterized protein YibQ
MDYRSKETRLIGILLVALILLVIGNRSVMPRREDEPPPFPKLAAIVKKVSPPPMKETVPFFEGPVKVIAPPKEIPAWKTHSVIVPVIGDKPQIVIIIDDMGMDRVHTREVAALPGPLTLSYMPYPPHIAEEVETGRAAGHEIMMHVPMEPDDKKLEDGAEDWFLNTGVSAALLKKTLVRDLAAFDGYVGINNHMGSRLTQDRAAMDAVMAELQERGLLFVDSRTIAASVAAKAAAEHQVPQATRDVFLDDVETTEAVNKQLADVERIARKYGHAVAIGHPKAVTIEALKGWLPGLEKKRFVLVPVSAVVSTTLPAKKGPVTGEETP